MRSSYAHYLGYLLEGLIVVVPYYAYLLRILRSGISPRGDDPKAWYDRAIRIVGPIMILAVLTIGFILSWNRK